MYKVNGNPLVPFGSIISYLSSSTPDSSLDDPEGWVIMNGQPRVNTNGKYDNLARTDNLWGTFSNGNYTPPDYRGAFLRGAGTNSNTNYSNYKGGSVGSVQTDRVGKHGHNVTDPGHNHTTTHSYERYNTDTYSNSTGGDGESSGSNEVNSNKTNITIQKSAGGDGIGDETRPFNYSVHWIIKY